MRESVFAALGGIEGASFLDLFSGSGVIALEAASRGAAFIEAVERDARKRPVLLANTAISRVRINCRFMPVELYIKRAKTQCFDYIFCDPPFNYAYKSELVRSIAASALACADTLFMLHYPHNESLKLDDISVDIRDRRLYGRSAVDFMKLSP
jgi:16S rRNA (guanine(966)-N(2))-methyltransferase RsmD